MINVYSLSTNCFLVKLVIFIILQRLTNEENLMFPLIEQVTFYTMVGTLIFYVMSLWECESQSEFNKNWKFKVYYVFLYTLLYTIKVINQNSDVINMMYASGVVICLIITACFVMHQCEKISETV